MVNHIYIYTIAIHIYIYTTNQIYTNYIYIYPFGSVISCLASPWPSISSPGSGSGGAAGAGRAGRATSAAAASKVPGGCGGRNPVEMLLLVILDSYNAIGFCGIPTPLKNMKVSEDHYSQYMEKPKMFQTTNQPLIFHSQRVNHQ